MDRIRALAGDQVCVDPGSIYRLLRGLEDQGFVESTWQTAESGPSRRVYTMTERGVDALEQLSGSLTHRAEALRRLADTALGSARLYRNAGAKKGLRVP
jgi:DNA-binding PadR family transcriptional regulator